MRPYGHRMGANDCKHSHVKEATLDGVRWLVCAKCKTPQARIPARPEAATDTEATMRRVMDKWLRGS